MKTVAVIFGLLVLIYLVAWLSSLDLLTLVGALLLIAAGGAALGALIVFCRRVWKRLNQIEENLNAIFSRLEEWERLKK